MTSLFEPTKGAGLSPSGYYRYWLSRTWDNEKPRLAFVMLNPSTADAYQDDPTIRRCIGFGLREDCGGIYVVNLFAGRATKPADLFKMSDPVGWANEKNWRIRLIHLKPKYVICAWGAEPAAQEQAKRFRKWAAEHNLHLFCLGKTKDGHPRHPLYLKNEAKLEPFT